MAFGLSRKGFGDEFAVMHSRLGHARIFSIGVITDNVYVIFGLKVFIDLDFAVLAEYELIIFKERVIGDTGGPDDSMALQGLIVDRQGFGGLRLDRLIQI